MPVSMYSSQQTSQGCILSIVYLLVYPLCTFQSKSIHCLPSSLSPHYLQSTLGYLYLLVFLQFTVCFFISQPQSSSTYSKSSVSLLPTVLHLSSIFSLQLPQSISMYLPVYLHSIFSLLPPPPSTSTFQCICSLSLTQPSLPLPSTVLQYVCTPSILQSTSSFKSSCSLSVAILDYLFLLIYMYSI